MEGVDYIFNIHVRDNYIQFNYKSNVYLSRGANGSRSFSKVVGYEEDGLIAEKITDPSKIEILALEADKAEIREKEMQDYFYSN